MSKIPSIIQPEELTWLNLDDEIVIIDASAGSKGRYDEQHLAGAIFADVNEDLANIGDFAAGGRHPLPTAEQFSSVLQKLGITKSTHVIVYDDKNGGNAAARFWWMLRAAGLEMAYVVSGGLESLVAAGFELTDKEPLRLTNFQDFTLEEWKLPVAGIDRVTEVSQKEDFLVIDVRENYRYRGESEPIDLVAGHIPGAVNIPYTSNLDETGAFLSPEKLTEKYNAVLNGRKPENVIVHCGSGVTACHTLLALEEAGITGANLYVGSWSEWSRNELPIATEKD